MIPYITEWMRWHDTIILEEPPADHFQQMLDGSVSIDDYLLPLDVEYPQFSRQMCRLLRDINTAGKKIFQVEPYLECLLQVHAFFADGHHPDELDPKSLLLPVYLAERRATGALLQFYRAVMRAPFDEILEAVKRFARLDAVRFRLRDSLRAQALVPLVKVHRSAFIEAGVMHYALWLGLKRQLQRGDELRLVFLADDAVQALSGKRRLYGPGDQLTLIYIFHPDYRHPARESLLAARALIHTKLVAKNELTDHEDAMPHIRDEIKGLRAVSGLSIDDCRHLFPLIRRVDPRQAHQIVSEHVLALTAVQ
jgi:hypothetical protein